MKTARFLKYVWPFFNIMKERVNGNIGTKWAKELNKKIVFFQQIIITIYCLYLNNTSLKRSFLRNKYHSEEITKSSVLYAFENQACCYLLFHLLHFSLTNYSLFVFDLYMIVISVMKELKQNLIENLYHF